MQHLWENWGKLNCWIAAPAIDFANRLGSIKVEFMLDIGPIFVAFVVLVLALLVGLLKFDAESWATKGLKRGDLYSLIDVASGLRPDGLTRDQAGRLKSRGMVRAYGNGHFRATVKGRFALRIRQAARHREQRAG